MHLFHHLIALSIWFSALAASEGHEHATSANKTMSQTSVKETCNEMQELTMLTRLAANQTLMEEFITKKKLNASEASALETKAASASTKLMTLSSNSTLVSECAAVSAHESLVATCNKMTRLEGLQKLASNTTALDELAAKRNLTQAAITRLKEQAANASTELKSLESNSTLLSTCQQLQSQRSNGTGSTTVKGSSPSSSSSSSMSSSTTTNGAIRLSSIGGNLLSSIGLLALAMYIVL